LNLLILMLLDSMFIIVSHLFSYFFLYPLINIPVNTFFNHLFLVVFFYLAIGLFTKVIVKINRFTSIRETIIHVLLIVSSFLAGVLTYNVLGAGIRLRYVTFAFLITVFILPSSRLIWRVWAEYTHKLTNKMNTPVVKTLLIGAGDAGAAYVRSLRNRGETNIVGFLDDNPNKKGTTLYGYPIIGGTADLEDVVNAYDVEQVTIAIPSLSNEEMKKILNVTKKLDVKTNKMPYIEDILSGKYKIDEFKEIEVTD